MSTPIFDAVMQEQGVDMMPLPPHQTHEEFLTQHGYYDLQKAVEEFMAGHTLALEALHTPKGNGRNAKGQFVKGGGAPVKKKRRE